MEQNEKKDWSKEESWQIGVFKTDKALLELCDNLKPASSLFPAHIHAAGEKVEAGERSLIRLNMLDYSNGKGENTISVYANISPEEVKYIYSALFSHLAEFGFSQEKIFGELDGNGYSIVQKVQINRYEADSQGRKRNYPWTVEIQNGIGIAVRNSNGGKYCKKDSYKCEYKVRLSLNDKDMFTLFARAEAYVRVFEQEFAFRRNRIGNFTSLYQMLKKEIQVVVDLLSQGEDSKAA